jgi:hypothetical protein
VNRDLYGDVHRLVGAIASSLRRREGEGVGEVLDRLAEQDLGREGLLAPPPQRLPAVRHLAQCVAETLLLDDGLAAKLAAVEEHLSWRHSASYSDALLGEGFMDDYGWCELVGRHGFFAGDDFRLGLMLLGPARHYRDHYHPAPELYWPLTGPTLWRRGGGEFEAKAAGATIWHEPNVVHATRTGPQPLLAVWCWTRDTAFPPLLVQ